MSPSYAERRASRGRPSTEDLYPAGKGLSKRQSFRERILRFFFNRPFPKSTPIRNNRARRDSLELAIRAYSAAKLRSWTDVYDHYALPAQPTSDKERYPSIYIDSPQTGWGQHLIQSEERKFGAQDGIRIDKGEIPKLNEGRALQSPIRDEQRVTGENGETLQQYEDIEAGNNAPRPKKRVHFII